MGEKHTLHPSREQGHSTSLMHWDDDTADRVDQGGVEPRVGWADFQGTTDLLERRQLPFMVLDSRIQRRASRLVRE